MSKCINTYGGCEKEAVPLEYRYGGRISITTNFCSDICKKMYNGDMKLKVKNNKTKSGYRIPPKEDWIVNTPNKNLPQTFVWDNTGKRYLQYHIGIGLINDDDTVIAKEDSNYFKSIIASLDSKTQNKFKKPKPSKIPNKPIKPVKLPKGYHICNNCGQIIRVIGQEVTNMLECPNCSINIFISKEDIKKIRQLPIKEILPNMI